MALQLAGAHYSHPEIELLMRLLDTDHDSLVNFTEFTSIITEDFLKNIEALFKIFDANGDGFLTQGQTGLLKVRHQVLSLLMPALLRRKDTVKCKKCPRRGFGCLELCLYGLKEPIRAQSLLTSTNEIGPFC